MENGIVENIAPARKTFALIVAPIAGLGLLAVLKTLVKLGPSHVWAPLSALSVLALLQGILELYLRLQTRRKWVIRDEGLFLTTRRKTEAILWSRIKETCKCASGLSLTYESPGNAAEGIPTGEDTVLLYLDDHQRQELLAVISAKTRH
jgi:hypothetical protein